MILKLLAILPRQRKLGYTNETKFDDMIRFTFYLLDLDFFFFSLPFPTKVSYSLGVPIGSLATNPNGPCQIDDF